MIYAIIQLTLHPVPAHMIHILLLCIYPKPIFKLFHLTFVFIFYFTICSIIPHSNIPMSKLPSLLEHLFVILLQCNHHVLNTHNVLLTSDLVPKISDYGMESYMQDTGQYVAGSKIIMVSK